MTSGRYDVATFQYAASSPEDVVVPEIASISYNGDKFLLPLVPATRADFAIDPRREASLITRINRFAVRTAMEMMFHIVYSSKT
jgi:hypothetical protein